MDKCSIQVRTIADVEVNGVKMTKGTTLGAYSIPDTIGNSTIVCKYRGAEISVPISAVEVIVPKVKEVV